MAVATTEATQLSSMLGVWLSSSWPPAKMRMPCGGQVRGWWRWCVWCVRVLVWLEEKREQVGCHVGSGRGGKGAGGVSRANRGRHGGHNSDGPGHPASPPASFHPAPTCHIVMTVQPAGSFSARHAISWAVSPPAMLYEMAEGRGSGQCVCVCARAHARVCCGAGQAGRQAGRQAGGWGRGGRAACR